MNNPFLQNKKQNVINQQPATGTAPVANRPNTVSSFSAPPTSSYPSVQAFTPYAPNNTPIAPPPSINSVSQQMSNMSLHSGPPPAKTVAPPPTGSVHGSYLATKGRYQVPSNAYQYASASQPTQPQSFYNPEAGNYTPQITPAYVGPTTSYDASAPAPAGSDPSLLPDEEYVKLSYEIAPNSNSLQSLCCLPFGAMFRPMAPEGGEIPVVSFGNISVQRCKSCRTYVNPFIQFTDGGRRWKCNMCGCLNDVPNEYFSQIDMSGKRIDLNQRPELMKGQVEFEAGAEYCLRPPMFPTYLFLIDVSYQSVASGMLQTICSAIRASLDDLIANVNNSTINVGFMTFDQTIHFYKLSNDHTPKQLVVGEIEEVFLPVPSSLLINLVDNKEVIESFLDSLPTFHATTKITETCTGNALSYAGSLLQDCGGKVLLFQASLPSTGSGKLKIREAVNVLGTEAEKELMKPSNDFYTTLATQVVERQMSIDLFLGGSQYTDVASLSTLVEKTGGQLFYYPNFLYQSPQAEALYSDIHHVLSRETGFEAVFRVRVPKNAKVSAFYGNFMLSNTDLMVIPVCHADLTVYLQFSIQETLSMPCFPIQSALLYTTSRGERRIRVHTISIPISNILSHLYERVNQDVITGLLLHKSIKECQQVGPSLVRQKIHQACISILRGVKAQEASVSTDAIPTKINCLPLYLMAMQKCSAFRGGCDNKSDNRCYAFQQLQQCSIDLLLRYLYPTLMDLTSMSSDACTFAENIDSLPDDIRVYGDRNIILPPILTLSLSSLSATNMYLLDDGFTLWLIVGNQVHPNELLDIFGVASLDGCDVSNYCLPLLDNDRSKKIHILLEELRVDRPYFCPLKIVRATDADFNKLKWRFVLDRDIFPGSNYSYEEYIRLITGGNSSY